MSALSPPDLPLACSAVTATVNALLTVKRARQPVSGLCCVRLDELFMVVVSVTPVDVAASYYPHDKLLHLVIFRYAGFSMDKYILIKESVETPSAESEGRGLVAGGKAVPRRGGVNFTALRCLKAAQPFSNHSVCFYGGERGTTVPRMRLGEEVPLISPTEGGSRACVRSPAAYYKGDGNNNSTMADEEAEKADF
ncbi:hypothetical protein EGR_02769 [Echinococcus granulosus]|uniref:Uncharacterized protein n=1 Tax=Echinococcus granulosus TaxID=6210 RepID=W6UMF5_ECHGR|nr:hypothetical protein EGR_02769 [Echinococcus granulosus]EUB62316.1 hypothetical protein EGR_02769 [Echinococcus granulosus]